MGVRYWLQPEQRAHREELVERQLAVMDVSAGQAPLPLQIGRRHHFGVHDQAAHARHVAIQRVEHGAQQARRARYPTSPRAA